MKEYIRFLFIARGSVEETRYLLLLARDLSYMINTTYAVLIEDYDILGRKLNALIKALKKH